jgi:hypothetical protein
MKMNRRVMMCDDGSGLALLSFLFVDRADAFRHVRNLLLHNLESIQTVVV